MAWLEIDYTERKMNVLKMKYEFLCVESVYKYRKTED